VSHKPQNQTLTLEDRNLEDSNLELENLELERLILEMTAAGAGITNAEITQLYQDTSDELRRLLVRKLGDEEGAEALAHDAYLKLVRIKHNQDIGDLRRYLFSMAVRLALNVLRKRKMDSQYYGCHDDSQTLSAQDSSAYKVLLDELRQESLKESLSQLPEKTRYIYLLHHFKGMSKADIANRLDIFESLVETHIDCAQDQTAKALTEFALMDV
jgi:RNA polymerase sigma-70 factor (ECF subfamily)